MEKKVEYVSTYGHPVPTSYIGFRRDLSTYSFRYGKQTGAYEYFTNILRPGVLTRGPSATCIRRAYL
jgi:hypothetical protein